MEVQLSFTHSSAFNSVCAITHRIVVLDDKGLVPVFNMLPNTDIEWEKILFPSTSLIPVLLNRQLVIIPGI